MFYRSIGLGLVATSLLGLSLAATANASVNSAAFTRQTAASRPAWQTSSATDPDGGTYRVVYAFSGSPPLGRSLAGGVLVDKNGNIFGTTEYPGYSSPGAGTLFELQPSGSSYLASNIAVFTGTNGEMPLDRPIEDSAGNLYVTTEFGGTASGTGYGTVSKFTYSSSVWSQSAIDALGSGSAGGDYPNGSPTEAKGTLLVATVQGGAHQVGAIYAIDPSSHRIRRLLVRGRSAG